MRPIHGGDWAGYEIEYGKEPLDFSMNVNPLGMPESVAKAITDATSKADRYPDPECRRLRIALAEHEGVPSEWIFCGNGAADIIDRIALATWPGRRSSTCQGNGSEDSGEGIGRALVTSPTFSEYEQALSRCGWKVDHFRLDENSGFRIRDKDPEGMVVIDETAYDIIFLCEPNNPTGVTTDRKTLERIADSCRKTGTMLVIDECFNGFLDDPDAHTMKGCLGDNPNLIILKAFTKIYGMAGVRLGYCICGDENEIRVIRDAGQPWNVSLLAEEAGLAALKEDDYLKRTRELIKTEKLWLREQLNGLGVGEVYGEANYLMFRWPPGSEATAKTEATTLPDILRRQGILVRDCSNFAGLDKGWYRIAVRKHEENEKLIKALRNIHDTVDW